MEELVRMYPTPIRKFNREYAAMLFLKGVRSAEGRLLWG